MKRSRPTTSRSPDGRRPHPAPAAAGRRRAAARQAAGPFVERRVAARKAAVRGGKGRPHRDARPARHGPPADLLRRSDQVRASPARRAQGVRRRPCTSGSRRRPATPKARSLRTSPVSFSRDDLAAALPRFVGTLAQMPPAIRRPQVSGPQLLRIRSRWHRDSARRARDHDRRDRARSIGRRRGPMLRVACGKGTYMRVACRGHRGRGRAAAPTCGAAAHGPRAVHARRRPSRSRRSRRWTSPARDALLLAGGRRARGRVAARRRRADRARARAGAGRDRAAGRARTIPVLRSVGEVRRPRRIGRRRSARVALGAHDGPAQAEAPTRWRRRVGRISA